MSPRWRREVLKRIYALLVLLVLGAIAWWWMIRMPGKSFHGPAADDADALAPLHAELSADVKRLAGEIGERNLQHYEELRAAADFIEESLIKAGYHPRRDGYVVEGKICENIEAEIPGTGNEIVVIGAHYDSVLGSPGANDNGSGVAALLALARRFAGSRGARTLRFVAFANEEPGYFQTELMGSWVYASRCKARGDRISAMISLETIGYFSDKPHSQKFPIRGLGFLYPTTGNFVAFVANTSSRKVMQEALKIFRIHAQIPSEGAALPSAVPGVGWSDHWAFWKQGYPAFMITDTAPFRYPHYHARSDTPDKLDYGSMARLVSASEYMIRELVGRNE